MHSDLEGFATIGSIIALGALLAHFHVLGLDSQVMLSRLSFFVASPALMVVVVSEADVAGVFSRNLVAAGARSSSRRSASTCSDAGRDKTDGFLLRVGLWLNLTPGRKGKLNGAGAAIN